MKTLCCIAALLFAAGLTGWAAEEKGGHEAVHGGCLNAIGSCDNGHAEIKLEGDTFRLWFVAGETHTDKAVRVPDKEVTLSVEIEKGKAPRTLVLTAKPIELAEEKVGDCSYFEGKADWLKDLKAFSAKGTVTFKGKSQEFRIDYPDGFDPDEKK
jgi:hypothetical protein